MTKVKDIFNFIDTIAPFNSAMDFDNVGILVGNEMDIVTKCIVALDITQNVITEAVNAKANLILSHHPVIFTPLSTLKNNSIPYTLAQNGINAICIHTNLDIAPNYGVNACLAKTLQLRQIQQIDPIGTIGMLSQEMTAIELAQFVEKKLHAIGVRLNAIEKKINRVIICSGSGGNLVSTATKLGMDALITGEIKHHEILFANDHNLVVIDAGHFATENVVVKPLTTLLSKEFKNVQFIESTTCTNPYANFASI